MYVLLIATRKGLLLSEQASIIWCACLVHFSNPQLTFISLRLLYFNNSSSQHHFNSLFCSIYGDNRVALFDRGDFVGNWSSNRSSLRCVWCASGSRQINFLPIAQHVSASLPFFVVTPLSDASGWGLMASSDDQSSTLCISLLSIYLVCSWFISNVRRAASQATSLVRTWVTAWASYCRLTVTGRAMFTLKTPQC